MSNFGAMIKTGRLARGWTLAELAERTGIAPSNLSRLESGGVDPRESTVRTVLGALALELVAIEARRRSVDDVESRMADGARRLARLGMTGRDVEARLAWKDARGLDTTVERRALGLDGAHR